MCVLDLQLFFLVIFQEVQRLLSSFMLPFSLSHVAAAADSADRSPRPTSAPAIAQSQVTEGIVPGASVKKTQKETGKTEVKGEEEPPEQAEPEPTEAWKVSPQIELILFLI
jgi:hypothetical protein